MARDAQACETDSEPRHSPFVVPHAILCRVNPTTQRLSSALADRYRLERQLGQGGMATVYLARDLKHDREVALKVLKPELAAVLGAERFVVEIKTTAALQHPHILPLFDSGTADGFLFYVMPYIQGETLRDKLNRETQLGVDEAIRIAREVLDALHYAHQHGIVHRDVKPENILLHGGHAMVADFGIALAVSAAAGGRMTETGLSLGTPHYMSPEQATAEKEISARSDVYSLGSVLYEMLAGQPPHLGGSAQQIIMRIITESPKVLTDIRRSVPPHVAAAVTKALEKLPADRFESAAAFAEALQNSRFTYGTSAYVAAHSSSVAASISGRAMRVAGVAVALVGVLLAGWAWTRDRSAPSTPVVPLMLNLPSANPDLGRFAVSPDGARFAFATDEGIVVRDAGQREYRLLTGTEMGESPCFLPDGQWIVYHARGHLRKIAITGGSPLALIPNDSLLSGTVHCGGDGSIVFQNGTRLILIPAGGTPKVLAKSHGAEGPRLTFDGRGVIYVDVERGSKLKYYDIAADTAYTILEDAAESEYLPTGHLLYTAPAGGLFIVRFDRTRHTVSGTPVPVINDLQPNGGVSPFVITRNGTLVYRAGVEPESRLLLRDPRGKVDTLPIAPKVLSYAAFSPNGKTLALTIGSARGTNRHTALYDLALGTLTRFTDEGGGHSPVWSPDGTRLAFTAEGQDTDAEDIFVRPVDRSAKPVRLFKLPSDQHASAWPVDTMLVYSSNNAPGISGSMRRGGTIGSVGIANPTAPGAPVRDYLEAQWAQSDASISPDGKWAAFTSLESGTPEVYLRHFPDANAGGEWKVSAGGGYRARWSGDGRTVYYQALDGKTLRAAHVTLGSQVAVGASEVVMTARGLGPAWDFDRATGRILMTQPVNAPERQIVVLQGWLEQFRRSEAGRP